MLLIWYDALTWFTPLLLLVSPVYSYTCEGYDHRTSVIPSDDQLRQLGEQIQGDVYLPGSTGYNKAGVMKDVIYSTKFVAIAYPENAADVQKILKFVNETGVRSTVVSSGHDYIGRSAGQNTLSINMTRINHIDVNQGEKMVAVGPGTIWIDIYKEVVKYNMVVVGGSAHTVSPSGYTMGGGHSPVTRTLGLSVDNTLEFTIVTSSGQIVVVTESGGIITGTDGSTEALDDGGDLLWSVLGGGGGVYGIVTEFKFKLHDQPDGFVRLSLVFPVTWFDQNCNGVATQALKRFFTMLRTNLTTNWGGYMIISKPNPLDPNRGTYGGAYLFFMNHWGGNVTEAKEAISYLSDFRPDCNYGGANFVRYNTFYDYSQTTNDPIYVRVATASRLIQDADLEEDSGLAELLSDINNFPSDWAACTSTIVGGASTVPSPDHRSITPAWRTAKLAMTCGAGWADPREDSLWPPKLAEFAEEKIYTYGDGVYYNEPGYYLKNWKTDYWGTMDRYNRLLRTKQKWDPNNMFWCHHCVGSDLVTYTSDEPCPTPFEQSSGGNSAGCTMNEPCPTPFEQSSGGNSAGCTMNEPCPTPFEQSSGGNSAGCTMNEPCPTPFEQSSGGNSAGCTMKSFAFLVFIQLCLLMMK